MPVPVTDWDVDLVRTYLLQDAARLRPMVSRLGTNPEVDGAGIMLRAAFVEAVHRRFAGRTRAEVVRFVAHARIRRGRNAPPLDPGASERLIIAALTGTRTDGLTEPQRAQQVILLGELIEDAAPTAPELEDFLSAARTYADRLAAAS